MIEPTPIITADIAENSEDEANILADQDQTFANADLRADNMGRVGRVSNDLEDEPADFIRGEIDVAEQMARTMRAVDDVLSPHHNLDAPDVPTGGLDALYERPEGVPSMRDRVDIPDTGDELTLPVETLDDIADENALSLADLGETSLEAAHASGYFGTESGQPEFAEDDRGPRTGAYTDLGAGRSATTRLTHDPSQDEEAPMERHA